MSKDIKKFPPSPQSDLFAYLRPEQQEFVKPILRVLKKPAQEELCVALIDYLETGIPEPPVTFNLGVIFMYIIHGCEPKGSDPADRKFLYPLRTNANRRQTECNEACFDCRGAKEEKPEGVNDSRMYEPKHIGLSSNRFSTSKTQHDYD